MLKRTENGTLGNTSGEMSRRRRVVTNDDRLIAVRKIGLNPVIDYIHVIYHRPARLKGHLFNIFERSPWLPGDSESSSLRAANCGTVDKQHWQCHCHYPSKPKRVFSRLRLVARSMLAKITLRSRETRRVELQESEPRRNGKRCQG